MSLILPYHSITAGIFNYLSRNSTTLDSGMYASITTIKHFDPDQNTILVPNFPCISIDLKSHDESRVDLALGQNVRREISCRWSIGCHVRTVDSISAVYLAMQKMVSNVEYVLRLDDTLSNTVQMANVISSDFGIPIQSNKGVWTKSGNIVLETYHQLSP